MNPMRIGCSTGTFRCAPLDDALDRIRAGGSEVIDLLVSPFWCPHFDPLSATALARRELRERIAGRGLRLCAIRAATGTYLVNDLPGGDIEATYQRRALELAAELECPLLLVHTGRGTWDATFEGDVRAVAGHLDGLGRRGRELGVRLAMVCPHVNQLGQFFDRAVRMIAVTDPEHVGVALDTAHVRLSGGSIEAALAAYGERVRHVYLRDYREGRYLMTPGDGDVDWAALFAGLDARGYAGDCTLLLEYPGESVEHHEREYRRALATVRAAAS